MRDKRGQETGVGMFRLCGQGASIDNFRRTRRVPSATPYGNQLEV